MSDSLVKVCLYILLILVYIGLWVINTFFVFAILVVLYYVTPLEAVSDSAVFIATALYMLQSKIEIKKK